MHYEHVWRAFLSEPLAILPEKLAEVRAFLELKVRGGEIDPAAVSALVAAREEREARFAAIQGAARRPDGMIQVGPVAILPVMGVLAQRLDLFSEMSGGVSAERVGSRLDALVADKSVKKIVMAFDSPGGSVYGIEELGRKIRAAGEQKKIVGIADSVAASAAYWLIAQTGEVNVTPGGQVGSIGVIVQHVDDTQAEALKGEKSTFITSSPYKAETVGPLTDEARAELQRKVDHYHGLFVAAIAKGRGMTPARVEKDFGQGRMVTAQAAVDRGMADRVATLEQVLSRLGADVSSGGPSAEAKSPTVGAKVAAARARAVQVAE